MLLRTHEYQFILLSFLLLLVSCNEDAHIPNNAHPSSAMSNVTEIIKTEDCSAPCLFGTSLQGATYEEIRGLLETSHWMDGADVEFNEHHVFWEWSDEVTPQLVSDQDQGLSSWTSTNLIDFRDNILWSTSIAFSLSVDDIINEYGNEFQVYPFGYNGRLTTYALAYPQFNGGVFEAKVACINPEITPDTLVVGFSYNPNIQQQRIAESSIVQWVGYDTRIPADCSPFQP
jgi:hypothetical protein